MIYKCRNCRKLFKSYKLIKTTYESYYGISGDFPTQTPLELEVCPYCDSEDFESLDINEYVYNDLCIRCERSAICKENDSTCDSFNDIVEELKSMEE